MTVVLLGGLVVALSIIVVVMMIEIKRMGSEGGCSGGHHWGEDKVVGYKVKPNPYPGPSYVGSARRMMKCQHQSCHREMVFPCSTKLHGDSPECVLDKLHDQYVSEEEMSEEEHEE